MSHTGNVPNFFSRFVLSVRWCIPWVSKTLRNAFENFFKRRGPLCVRCHFAPELTLQAKYFDLACSRAFILDVFPNAFFYFKPRSRIVSTRKVVGQSAKRDASEFLTNETKPKIGHDEFVHYDPRIDDQSWMMVIPSRTMMTIPGKRPIFNLIIRNQHFSRKVSSHHSSTGSEIFLGRF